MELWQFGTRKKWEHWDLNPDQRVSTCRNNHTWSYRSTLQLIIIWEPVVTGTSEDPLAIIPVTGARDAAVLHHTPMYVVHEPEFYYYLAAFAALFLRRIFFFRHFQRCCPLFFQALELRFIFIAPNQIANSS